jgi:hypothetical protein
MGRPLYGRAFVFVAALLRRLHKLLKFQIHLIQTQVEVSRRQTVAISINQEELLEQEMPVR